MRRGLAECLPVTSHYRLKHVLQSKLNLSLGRARRINAPGGNVSRSVAGEQAGVRDPEVRMVRDVEELRTELQPLRFIDLEILTRRKIQRRGTRAHNGISTHHAFE